MEDLMKNDFVPDTDRGPASRRRSSLSMSSIRIISKDELDRVVNKFKTDSEFVYDEAVKKFVSLPILFANYCII